DRRLALEEGQELLFLVHADQRRHERADAMAHYDAREQAAQVQGLDDTEVAEPVDGAALQEEPGAAVRLARVVQQVHLVLGRHAVLAVTVHGQTGEVADCQAHASDVLVDQDLGAGVGDVVEVGAGDVAEAADQAGAEEGDDVVDVVLFLRDRESVQAVLDEPSVEVLSCWIATPQVRVQQPVKREGGGFPFFEGRGVLELV
ncbi:MAG: hypothetical protein LQ340_005366, partial [Diploschistes diacapsis]